SVVPPLTEQVVDDVRSHFNEADLYVVHHEMALPFEMAYETPETLGTDRLAAAAAAWLSYGASGRAVLVVDAGTAVTIEAITSSGVYLGGAIAPGPEMLRQSLSNETAQLPSIQWPETLKPIGRNTREAIEAGLSGLFLDGVRGLVNRTAGKLNTQPVVVATGGWASWISYHLEEIDVVAPDLVLDGIRTLVNYQFET
ncbi:MAG: type III pantothenate kinase, partial [Rubricoccaceae bacterium]|nr:type III pantothenate kinase [Rubricoccaceae bacterium]